jgi:hypothetical protein
MVEQRQPSPRRSRLAPDEIGAAADQHPVALTTGSAIHPDEQECMPVRVVVTDVRIRFWSMVTLLVQLALAAIPAVMVLAATAWALAMLIPRR